MFVDICIDVHNILYLYSDIYGYIVLYICKVFYVYICLYMVDVYM